MDLAEALENARKPLVASSTFVPEIIDPIVKAEHIRLTEGYPLRRDNSKIQARKDGYIAISRADF